MESGYFTLTGTTIKTLTFTRPDCHNAFNAQMIGELTKTLEQISLDKAARVLVIKSTGASFSAGADLNWMKDVAGFSRIENYDDAKALSKLMETLNRLPLITVAAIQGSAFGGGLGLIACCDIALSVTSALFCLSEVALGLVPAVISPYVIRAISTRQARRFFVSAERFDAQKALEIGLIHEVVSSQEDLALRVETLTKQLIRMAPEAQVLAKKMVLNLQERPALDSYVMKDTIQWIVDRRASEEGKEGITAFLEKRTPKWVP